MRLLKLFGRTEPKEHSSDPRIQNVAREISKRRNALIELDEQTRSFTRQDIGKWRKAHEAAVDVENPRRAELYNVYADAMLNEHLEGCFGQIEDAVKARQFVIKSAKSGKEIEDKTAIFKAPWFGEFLHLVLETEAWGHSLIELGNIIDARGQRIIDKITLIPREHVVPERGLILPNVNDEFSQGIDYRNNPKLSPYLIEIEAKEPLGLLLKVAPSTISIKNAAGFWDTFAEMFGIPVRWASSPSDDPADKASIMSALRQMGAAAYALFPEGTEIHFLETQKGDAFEVFDRRIVRAQNNISKAILKQTMTLEDGSSLSQAEVHLDIFDRLIDSRLEQIANIVNWQLLPKLQAMGMPFTDDDRFEWDNTTSYTPEQQVEIEKMVLQYYEVDPSYFADKYGILITGAKQQPMLGGISAELKKKVLTTAELDHLYGLNTTTAK